MGLLLVAAKLTARRLGGGAGSPVRVLARQSISRGSGVVVVRVGERVLVLGATEQQVSLLTEIDPAELDVEEPAEEPAARPAGSHRAPAQALNGSVLSPAPGSRPWRRSPGGPAARAGSG
ncbi:flagellar biosynthetic protein FliO [Nocardioides sp. TF02-7]|uniref:flagellar biosynthetic protein FliO n=1 Tax=Nocardioides sp. TF02-7 TaxID=2917724 RepID=UPI001F066D47|nr:flagellar biosynthetic protein FliO [Nocardioides sp. TF02-7]UMG92969.1 flagellar biosynthetic protein FliO [Nocardioides sp. TF02-7]